MREGHEAKELRKTKLIAFLLLVLAPVVYLLIAFLIHPSRQGDGETEMVFYILFVLALFQPAILPVMGQFQIRSYRSSASQGMSPGQLFTSMSIIKYAFIESIYLYGFVIYLISGDIEKMWYFYPLGVIWSAIHWPRQSSWEKFQKSLEGYQ